MNEMSEALAAIEGKVELAPSKIPEGKTVVAIRLDRDETVSGKFMTAVKAGWRPHGMAAAIKDGHVIAANHVFGRISNGVPKVIACHISECTKCGKRELTPVAVWKAKEDAVASGVTSDLDRGISAKELLARYGKCPDCGGSWRQADSFEKETLASFSKETMTAISSGGTVPRFLCPRGFVVRPVEEGIDLGEDWFWLGEAMAKNFKAAVPAAKDLIGDLIIFNPGFWLGWVDDKDSTELFFKERGEERDPRGHRTRFNPHGYDGL